MLKSLDPDQAQHFVGSDLGPNCLQRLILADELFRTILSGIQSDECQKVWTQIRLDVPADLISKRRVDWYYDRE